MNKGWLNLDFYLESFSQIPHFGQYRSLQESITKLSAYFASEFKPT